MYADRGNISRVVFWIQPHLTYKFFFLIFRQKSKVEALNFGETKNYI